jgi:hypothetical protein
MLASPVARGRPISSDRSVVRHCRDPAGDRALASRALASGDVARRCGAHLPSPVGLPGREAKAADPTAWVVGARSAPSAPLPDEPSAFLRIEPGLHRLLDDRARQMMAVAV